MTTEHSNKPGLLVASVSAMCRLKEATDQGEVRISMSQKLVVDHIADRAATRHNGAHAVGPMHLAKCMSNVF